MPATGREMSFWPKNNRRTGDKPPKKMGCPVCKGQRFVRMTPAEADSWEKRGPNNNDVLIAFVMRPCWACNGQGEIRVENRGYDLTHFDR